MLHIVCPDSPPYPCAEKGSRAAAGLLDSRGIPMGLISPFPFFNGLVKRQNRRDQQPGGTSALTSSAKIGANARSSKNKSPSASPARAAAS
jgi:hypothetical protein